jgi:hypothetical protein
LAAPPACSGGSCAIQEAIGAATACQAVGMTQAAPDAARHPLRSIVKGSLHLSGKAAKMAGKAPLRLIFHRRRGG